MIKLVNIVNITHTHTWSTLTWCILQARCYTFTCVAGIADFVCHALYNAVTDPVRSKICRNCVSKLQIFIKIFLDLWMIAPNPPRNPSSFFWNCIIWFSIPPTFKACQLVIQQVALFGHTRVSVKKFRILEQLNLTWTS